MNLFLKIGAATLATIIFAAPAFASVTYHYSGHNATNSEGTSAYPYVPLHAPMTFDFTVASPLAADLSNVDILSTVLSWTASGGTALSTITSSDPSGAADRIRLSTDSVGDITTYRIFVAAKVAAQPDTEADFFFERLLITSTQSDETFQGYSLSRGGSPFVAATCSGTGGCGGPTTFAAITAVPVPAAAWLFGSGVMGLAGLIRKRKTA